MMNVYLTDSMDDCDGCGEPMNGVAVNIELNGRTLAQFCFDCAYELHVAVGETLKKAEKEEASGH